MIARVLNGIFWALRAGARRGAIYPTDTGHIPQSTIASDAGAKPAFGNLKRRTEVLVDKGYDVDWIRAQITAYVPNKSNRQTPYPFRKKLYRELAWSSGS